MSERDPVNILGELIDDAVIRYSGQIGTLASAHVAEEVIAHLRAHPEDAAAALGWESDYCTVGGSTIYECGIPRVGDPGKRFERVVGPWVEADRG